MEDNKRNPVVQYAASLLALVIGSFLALLAVEVGVRLMPKNNGPVSDRPKTYYSHELSRTLQDYPYKNPKDRDVFRIAAVGDSFTFGPYLQFDDTYPKRLERWLNLNAQQRKVEVVNYGVPRYSTYHEVGIAKKALERRASMILLQITLNDPEIKLDWPTELLPDQNGNLNQSSWLSRHWKTYAWVKQRLNNTRSQRLYREYFFKLYDEKSAGFQQFRNSLSRIRQLGSMFHKPVVAVIFPLFGVEVGPDYPFFPIHKKIGEMLKARGIPYLDLAEAYRGIKVEHLQVLPGYDRHPNEIAHRIAAEQIMNWFAQEKLVPEEILPKRLEPERVGIHSRKDKLEGATANRMFKSVQKP